MGGADMIGNLVSMSIESPAPECLIGPKAPHNFPASPQHKGPCKRRAPIRAWLQSKPTCGLSIFRNLNGVNAGLASLSGDEGGFAALVHNVCLILLIRIDAQHRVLTRHRHIRKRGEQQQS